MLCERYLTETLQGWLVLAFVGTGRVSYAGIRCQRTQTRVGGAAELALIFCLFAPLIKSVFSLARPKWMPHAGICRQGRKTRIRGATIFAIVVHGLMEIGVLGFSSKLSVISASQIPVKPWGGTHLSNPPSLKNCSYNLNARSSTTF